MIPKATGRVQMALARTLWRVAPDRSETAADAAAQVLVWSRELVDRHEAVALLRDMGPAARPAARALVRVLAWSEAGDAGEGTLADQLATMGIGFRFARRAKRDAADLLGELGAEDAKPALEALRDHEDPRLRYRAARALRRIG